MGGEGREEKRQLAQVDAYVQCGEGGGHPVTCVQTPEQERSKRPSQHGDVERVDTVVHKDVLKQYKDYGGQTCVVERVQWVNSYFCLTTVTK